MSLIASITTVAAEAAEAAHDPAVPFIAAGIAFAVFLTLGVVTWSYRDVANRNVRIGATNSSHDSHSAGH